MRVPECHSHYAKTRIVIQLLLHKRPQVKTEDRDRPIAKEPTPGDRWWMGNPGLVTTFSDLGAPPVITLVPAGLILRPSSLQKNCHLD